MFIGLYMLSLFVIIYLKNKNSMYDYPESKPEPVSIVMPCYNDGKTIGAAIESLLDLDYPKNMLEIIIVDDCSKDDSVEIIKSYVKKHKNVRLIINTKNSGGAAEPTNIGIKAAKYNYIAVADSDSTPKRDALKKMLGFLQEDEKVGAVTCSVLVKNPKNFIQKLQAIEYAVIAFGRKLLDKVDAVYVTPGPFALYRKKTLIEVGMFDTKNITQDIEIVWRLLSKGYKARMCLATSVYSESPNKFKAWYNQRIRWTIGGTQTLLKYKSFILRKGMLGIFIIPFFAISLFLGLIGLCLFTYLLAKRMLVSYLAAKYSIYAGSALFHFQDLTFTPSLLNYFGAVMFLLGTAFTIFSLVAIKDKEIGNNKWFNIGFYMIVYLTVYPIILVISLCKFARGKYSWGKT
jgi:cellulose synthase/poly-beta-1,6-N-acetylglucosamine synthase-like glycosyltransferase